MKLDVLATDSHGRFTSAVTYGPDSSAKVRCVVLIFIQNVTLLLMPHPLLLPESNKTHILV